MTGKKIGWGLFAVLLLGFTVLLSIYGYRQARVWRASHFAHEAKSAMGSGNVRLAMEKLRLAQQMAPQSAVVLRAIARQQFLQRDPRGLATWIELVNRDYKSAVDWEGLFLASMQAGNKKLAYRAIDGFKVAAPGNVKVLQFECRLLVSDGRYGQAAFLARELVRDPKQEKEAQLFAYEVLLSGTESDRQLSQQWLREKMKDDDLTGLSAAVILARAKKGKEAENGFLLERLRGHPLSGVEHRILAESLQINQTSVSRKDRELAWVSFGRLQKDADRYTLTRWLLSNGQVDSAAALIGKEEALTNDQAEKLYIDVLGEGKRWEELKNFLLSSKGFLPEARRLLFLCRAYFELGETKLSELQWRLALAASRSSTDQLSYLANYAAVMRWDDKAREVCTILEQNPATEGLGLNGLLLLAYQRGDKIETERMMGKIVEQRKKSVRQQ